LTFKEKFTLFKITRLGCLNIWGEYFGTIFTLSRCGEVPFCGTKPDSHSLRLLISIDAHDRPIIQSTNHAFAQLLSSLVLIFSIALNLFFVYINAEILLWNP